MKRSSKLLLGLVALVAIASFPIGSALAQSTVTYLSGTGNDMNPCNRTQPCLSFVRAYSVTLAGGEIMCLDPGGFGTLTIAKPLTIDCGGSQGHIGPTGVSGITVNAGAADKVTIRNMMLNGAGPPLATSGIDFLAGGELNVENVTFENFSIAGINVNKSTFGVLTVRNASFTKIPIGIKLQTSAGNIVASISDSKFNGMSLHGVEANARSYAAVTYSVFSTHNGSAMIASTPTSTVYAKNNTITNCGTGINANAVGAKITASGNGIYGNSKAFNVVAGATFLSANNNEIDVNPGNPPTGALTSR